MVLDGLLRLLWIIDMLKMQLKMQIPLFVVLIAFLVGGDATTTRLPRCKCTPDSHCWPRNKDWRGLNHTLSGRLLAVRPASAVCHNPTFEAAECKTVNENFFSSAWRDDQPGILLP